MNKWIYNFNDKDIDGSEQINLLGGKGANLAQMSLLGLPVPPGFTISTQVCNYYLEYQLLPKDFSAQMAQAMHNLEQDLSLKFGDIKNPLLISVRSGARSSMPGMLDTILNVGLNDQTVMGLAKKTKDERFAYDSYRRLIQMYSSVVLNIEHENFEELLENKKRDFDVLIDNELPVKALQELISEYKQLVLKITTKEFPQDVNMQVNEAIKAVFSSWLNTRAVAYRNINDIPSSWGTAVNIQAMVFGNMGENSATGVAFTRNPSTGENIFYGEYLINAQGEDVVAGIRTPQAINKIGKESIDATALSLEEVMPLIYQELLQICQKLEACYLDMQDIEFTIENQKLWILQTRTGKRSANAAIKIAVDLVSEKLITKEQAILRIKPQFIEQLLHPTIDDTIKYELITKGLPASPGAVSGMVVFNSEDAIASHKMALEHGVILVRTETSPEDISGMHAALGVLTARGGMTSHAAVVARGMGKPCVCGANLLMIDEKKQLFKIADTIVKKGDIITIDGATGNVILGAVSTVKAILSKEYTTLMNWADSIKNMQIRANAENLGDVKVALEFGAKGIGLCRTEHMFFDESRINIIREMILAEDSVVRKKVLNKLLPMQRQDFVEIFTAMKSLPVNIRLLDPPLHEFLPHTHEEMSLLAKSASLSLEQVKQRTLRLKEVNPMMGHRGCRLAVSYPEIYEMQVRAIFEAYALVYKVGIIPQVEIMIPLVIADVEFNIMKNLIDKVALKVMQEAKIKLSYAVGSMIELPRAALNADKIAHTAAFMSFGSNDLTQATLGISRDDAGGFLSDYQAQGILPHDPFVHLDQQGVGELISMAAKKARKIKPEIKLGVCGEHGGDPQSIEFFNAIGLDYVSCSPYRIPIARIAAAQAVIKKSAIRKKINKPTAENAILEV
jgi:pyruvate, orthophosphate dikinase